MKKLVAIAVLGMITMTSCLKTYNCECTTTSSSGTYTSIDPVIGKKKAAKTACESDNGTAGGVTTTCKIK